MYLHILYTDTTLYSTSHFIFFLQGEKTTVQGFEDTSACDSLRNQLKTCCCSLSVKNKQGFVSAAMQLYQVVLKSRTNFGGKEKNNWSTLIDLQLLIVRTDVSVSSFKGCTSITELYLKERWKRGIVYALTCQGSVQCSHVRRTAAGRPLGSKLSVRPPENPYPAHTAPELTQQHSRKYLCQCVCVCRHFQTLPVCVY